MDIFVKLVAIGGMMIAMGFGFFILQHVHVDLKSARGHNRAFLKCICRVVWITEVFAFCGLGYFILIFPK